MSINFNPLCKTDPEQEYLYSLVEENKKLKYENKSLKEENEYFRNQIETLQSNCNILKSSNNSLQKENRDRREDSLKNYELARKSLDSIKKLEKEKEKIEEEDKKIIQENEKLKKKNRGLQSIVNTYFWNIKQAGNFDYKMFRLCVNNEVRQSEKLWRTQKHCQEAKIEAKRQKKYNSELLEDKMNLKVKLRETEKLLTSIKLENKEYEERLKELDRLRPKEKDYYTVWPQLYRAEVDIRHLKNEIDLIYRDYILIKKATVRKREADEE